MLRAHTRGRGAGSPLDYPYPEYAERGQFVYDVKGVQEGFADVLRFNEFLRKAKPMTFEVSGEKVVLGPTTATWSGMATADRALVRAISFARGEPTVRSIAAFGRNVEVSFAPRGNTYWVYPDGRVDSAE